MSDSLREKLARLEHDQWCHWMHYMIMNLTQVSILRWRRQMDTSYDDLSEAEKESDREWADKVLAIINEHFRM